MAAFDPPRYSPAPCPGADEAHRVVISGGGLVGLTLALDLARRGIGSVLLDEDGTVSTGSRAICIAKRSLEIFDRLGLGAQMLAKGVTWNTGRVFFGPEEIFRFDLLPERGHEYPAFINLQQYYVEAWLVEACAATGLVDLRWRHQVTAVETRPRGALLAVTTPDGSYRIETDWLLAADGARSFIRRSMDLPFVGRVFQDRFLIADVVMRAPFPAERWFWFDPPFHRGQSALLHKQPDDLWRIDLQLGWDADAEREAQPDRVIPRVQAMLGPDMPFKLEWVSVYTFRCRRLERFVHGRTVFVGDSAHQVSPFGARGGNGGVQDADNLAWKLAAVLRREAPESLVGTYDEERIPAADENILNSTRGTDFITPKSAAVRAYRDAVLRLASKHAFARPMVNSGRLSRPSHLADSSLTTREEGWAGGVMPGSPAEDAPIIVDGAPDWLLPQLHGGFTLLSWGDAPVVPGIRSLRVGGDLHDHEGMLAARYAAPPDGAILFRPDNHVAARFSAPTGASVTAARDRALARVDALAAVA